MWGGEEVNVNEVNAVNTTNAGNNAVNANENANVAKAKNAAQNFSAEKALNVSGKEEVKPGTSAEQNQQHHQQNNLQNRENGEQLQFTEKMRSENERIMRELRVSDADEDENKTNKNITSNLKSNLNISNNLRFRQKGAHTAYVIEDPAPLILRELLIANPVAVVWIGFYI